jgi:hypothetical protein
MSATGQALLRKTTSKSFQWDRGSSSLDEENGRCGPTLARKMAAKRNMLEDIKSSRRITRSRGKILSNNWDSAS